MALIGALTPDRVATAGPPGVYGRKYGDIIPDMIESLLATQAWTGRGQDGISNGGEGGWWYQPRLPEDGDSGTSNGGEGSVAQWPMIAIYEAEHTFGMPIPDVTRNQLKKWVHFAQNGVPPGNDSPDLRGGGGYSSDTDYVTSGKSGGLLVGYRSVYKDTPDILQHFETRLSLDYFDTHLMSPWSDSNGMYDMYSMAKGFRVGT
jgi:hypothetical protein